LLHKLFTLFQQTLNTEVIQKQDEIVSTPSSHPNCLISLKRYKKLITMAQESHKPIFHLKPTDGAIGVHIYAVRDVYKDFKDLGEKIASRTELVLPNSQLTLEPELKSFKCIERLGCRSNGEFERQ
jgi:hypothetical protein